MIYIISLLFVVFGVFAILPIDKRIKNVWLLIFSVILALVAGVRGEGIDRDYHNYVANFVNLQPPNISFIEPAFFFIGSFIKLFSDEVVYLFVAFSSISLIFKYLSIRKGSDNFFLSLLLLLANIYIIQDLTQIRAAVGASLLMWGLLLLVDGEKKKFFFISIVAILFHYTSLIIVLFVFLDSKRINRWFWAIVIPSSYILLFVNITPLSLISYIPIPTVQSKMDTYIALQQQDAEKGVNIFNSLVFLRYFIILFMIGKIDELKELNKYCIILLKVYILSLVALILTSQVSTLAFRLNEYLSVVEIIVIPMITLVVRPRVLSYVFIVIFSMVLFYLHYRAETLLIFLQENG